MTAILLPDAPEEPSVDRVHVKRRMTVKDWVTMVSGLAGAAAGLTVIMGSLADALPYEQKTPYALDQAAQDHRFQTLESSTQINTTTMASIQRNSQMVLKFQLQHEIEALNSQIKKTAPNDPGYYGMLTALDRESQQLDDITRALGR